MKVYLVGGAVRDELLGLPVKEKDWVVVGATKEELLKQHYNQVGRDFPVFLHPKTKEEYALARTERKSAPGYYGFVCDFSPKVTLEEDLARRDLTINAMAKDEKGKLIDPFFGKDDLTNKILRHVSDAFVEDPVRVLRIARFAARYHHLGFKLANETRQLMYEMVKKGELSHLVPERVWQEWLKSLSEKNPEQFILTLRSCDALKVIFPEIEALFGVPNTYQYHREIDSGVHTMMVLQACVARSADPMTRFSALVHDLGKAKTPMQKWPRHHGHEMAGVPIIKALCERLKIPNDYTRLATMVSQYHLIIHRLLELRPATIVDLLEKTDAFRRPSFFNEMLIACEADAHGRGLEINYEVGAFWKDLLELCIQVKPAPFIAKGYEGKALGEVIRKERINLVKKKLTLWKSDEKK